MARAADTSRWRAAAWRAHNERRRGRLLRWRRYSATLEAWDERCSDGCAVVRRTSLRLAFRAMLDNAATARLARDDVFTLFECLVVTSHALGDTAEHALADTASRVVGALRWRRPSLASGAARRDRFGRLY